MHYDTLTNYTIIKKYSHVNAISIIHSQAAHYSLGQKHPRRLNNIVQCDICDIMPKISHIHKVQEHLCNSSLGHKRIDEVRKNQEIRGVEETVCQGISLPVSIIGSSNGFHDSSSGRFAFVGCVTVASSVFSIILATVLELTSFAIIW